MPPGFRPADYLQDPDQFGRTPEPDWREVDDEEAPYLAASQLQHRIAYQLRTTYGTDAPRAVAEHLGQPYRTDYIRRKLNGQVPLNLVELFQWAQKLGIDLAGYLAELREGGTNR